MRKILFLSILCITITSYSCDFSGYPSGARVYKGTCANCHLDQGEGLGALIPPLANSDYWNANRNKLACIARYGLADTIKVNGVTYQEKMLAMPGLSDIQITNVLNYIGSRWGNHTAPFRLEEVRAMLKDCNSLPTGDTKTKQ